MFSNYQILEIQKTIRNFLWSDGKGKKKMHSVKWEWCHKDKSLGGLGLKNPRIQEIALSTKWIFQALDGNEPWKVLVRNNILKVVPKKAKTWKSLPFCDLVAGDFEVSVQGSNVFKSIWKAWSSVKPFISNNRVSKNEFIHGGRSIWWNLLHSSKPLALSQGCSAKAWATKGICDFKDIIKDDRLLDWDTLRAIFNLLSSHKCTYNMLQKACENLCLPKKCKNDIEYCKDLLWNNAISVHNIKDSVIYKNLTYDEEIISHANNLWFADFLVKQWQKVFNELWSSRVTPKEKCFKWLSI